MTIVIGLLFVLSIILLAVTANFATAVFCMAVGVTLEAVVYSFANRKDKGFATVHAVSFVVNTLYAVLCFAFMRGHGYNYLLTFDTDNVIMPMLNHFLTSGHSYWATIGDIWSQYDFFDRFQVGYYSYLYTWGYFTQTLGMGIDNYFVIQLAHYAFASFIAPLLYKILLLNGIERKKAIRYSLVIALCSILFFYSSTIIRDGMIATLTLYIYYVMMHSPTFSNYVKVIIAVYLISTLRIESGLFSAIFIPLYYYIWMGRKDGGISYFFVFFIIAVFGLSLFIMNYSRAVAVYNFNYATYVEGVDEGGGVIGFLQRIPVLGNILSIIYIALLPMPFWAKMFVSGAFSRPECYNLMCFPIAIATFFNTYIITYLFWYLCSGMKLTKGKFRFLNLLMIPGFALLYLQSAVVAQRRVMAAYAVFYMIWAMIHSSASKKLNNDVLLMASTLFIIIQLSTGLR